MKYNCRNCSRRDVIDPSTLEAFAEVELKSWATVDGWLDEMTKLHNNRECMPGHKRIDILKRTAELMAEQHGTLSMLIAQEGGKPLKDAKAETDRAINGVELAIHELYNMKGSQIPMDLTAAGAGRSAFTFHEPIGPVVAISAFNHPLNLIVHQVIPAIATGCPVIVKPADDTPLCAQKLVGILYEAGLPEVWCRVAPCEIEVAEKMVTDPRTAFLTFIGSEKVGWMLKSKLAPGTRCALEHGGVAPVIIDTDADLEKMLPSLVKGGFYHSGQVCVSVQRIFVPRKRADKFTEALCEKVKHLNVGDAKLEATDCGPLIRPAEVDRIEKWVDTASEAKVVMGGKRLSENFYAPTVLLGPAISAEVSTKEIFGPVVCVYPYDDLSTAIDQSNALPYSFQAAVFTDRLSFAAQCIQELQAAAVMVNEHSAFRVDWMPFAGRQNSGYGTGGIGHTMADMTQEKLAVIKL